jgi:hypothetical protein
MSRKRVRLQVGSDTQEEDSAFESEGEGEEADEYTSSRPAIAKNVIGGVRLLPYAPPPSINSIVEAFVDDAQRPGYRPCGRADHMKLRRELERNATLAQARQLQPADPAAVETGNAGARQLVDRFRVEKKPMSTAELDGAHPVDHRTSWVLGANPDTTRDTTEVGQSAFPAQEAPYVKAADGSVVPTLDTIKLQHAMLDPDPNNPDHTSVRTWDLLFATPFDSNERQSKKNRTYKDPSKDKSLVDECAPFSVMPGLRSQTSWATVSDGDAQLGALERLVHDSAIECVWHAGPSVMRLFGKVPSEVELTPNPRTKQRFGLFFVVLPDPRGASTEAPEPSPPEPSPPKPSLAVPLSPPQSVEQQQPPASAAPPATLPLLGKWEVIVASHPKLKGPNATPTAAVQTITGSLNVLRQWSDLQQIDPTTSPLWFRTSKVHPCIGWGGVGRGSWASWTMRQGRWGLGLGAKVERGGL